MHTQPPRIFISHSSKDHHFCLQLVGDLQRVLEDEDAVWYDVDGGLAGSDAWWHTIEQELSTRNIFMVVLSPEAVTSKWVNDEIDIARRRTNDSDPASRMRLFPVLYQPCEIRPDLRSLHIISFVPPKRYEAAFEELLFALGLATDRSIRKVTQEAPLTPQKTKEQWLNEGVRHFDAKRYEQAITDYDHAIELDSQYTLAYFNRGNAYYGLKRYWQAIADYDRVIQLDPQYTDAFINRGNACYTLIKLERAIADYDRVIQLDPQYTLAYFNRGNTYFGLKRYEQAIADYDRVLQLDPQYTDAFANRGNAYRSLNEYEQAIADYDRAIQLDPQYTLAYFNRGNTSYALKRYEQAIADYDRAIQLDPKYTLAYFNRGNASYALKRYVQAVADYDRAIELDPKYTDVRQWREQALRRLQGQSRTPG
jgi:tetratricopeptide (TPR) repeat protein